MNKKIFLSIVVLLGLSGTSFAQDENSCDPDILAPTFVCNQDIEIVLENIGQEEVLDINTLITTPEDNCSEEQNIVYGFDDGSTTSPQLPVLLDELIINCANTGSNFLVKAIDESDNETAVICSINVISENCNCSDNDQDGICDQNDDDDDNDGVLDQDEVEGCETMSDCDEDGISDIDDTCPDIVGQEENLGCPLPDIEVESVTITNQDTTVGFAGVFCRNSLHDIHNSTQTTIAGEIIVAGSIKGTAITIDDYNSLSFLECMNGTTETFNKTEVEDGILININTGQYTETSFVEETFINNTIKLTLCTDDEGNISIGTPDCPDQDGNNEGLCIIDENSDGRCDPHTSFHGELDIDNSELTIDQIIDTTTRNENCSNIEINPNTLTCTHLGDISIQITATNQSQSTYSCNITGTLADISKPTIECQEEIIIQPMEDEVISITYENIVITSGDNCNIDSIQIIENKTALDPIIENEITCEKIVDDGLTSTSGEVTVQVTDTYGLTGSCDTNIVFDISQCNIECLENEDCENEDDTCINQHCYEPDHPCIDLGGDSDQDGICDDDENTDGTDPENPCDPDQTNHACCLENGLGGNDDNDTLCNDEEEHPGCTETEDCDGDGIPDDEDDCDLEYEENTGCLSAGPVCNQ